MERAFSAPTEAEPERLYRVVSDLGTYPEWMDLVFRVLPETDPMPSAEGDDRPAWAVTLRARIGPLARSKRLRMVRTVHDGRLVRFERRELDGRYHSRWTLSAEVTPLDDDQAQPGPWRSEVRLELAYEGSMWSGLLDGVLQAAADDATERLQLYMAEQS